MTYHNDILITENKRPLKRDISDSDGYYKLTEDNDVKPELTWNRICEQLNKPRLRDTGIRNSKFSLINETLSNHRRNR